MTHVHAPNYNKTRIYFPNPLSESVYVVVISRQLVFRKSVRKTTAGFAYSITTLFVII